MVDELGVHEGEVTFDAWFSCYLISFLLFDTAALLISSPPFLLHRGNVYLL